MSIKVIAITVAKPEHRDFVKEEMEKLVSPSREDKGCIGYTMYEDLNDKNTFIMDEVWETPEDLEEHGKQFPLVNFKKITEGKLVSFDVNVAKLIK